MVDQAPTQKQRERFKAILDKKLSKLDTEIAESEFRIKALDDETQSKASRFDEMYRSLCQAIQEYSSEFNLNCPKFDPSEGLLDAIPGDSEIRRLITHENELKRKFHDEKTRRHNEIQKSIAEIQKLMAELEGRNPGKLRRRERRQAQRQFELERLDLHQRHELEMKSLEEVRELAYPRTAQLQIVQYRLREIDQLHIASDRRECERQRKVLRLLRSERDKLVLSMTEPQFEDACREHIQRERDKRREATLRRQQEAERELRRQKRKISQKKKEAELEMRRRKARAAALKSQITKNRKFLSDNPETDANRKLRVAKRNLETASRQYSMAGQACIRKVRQVETTQLRGLLNGMPKLEPDILNFLQSRTWPRIPSLDNLVARLEQRSKDLSKAQSELEQAEKLVEKIQRINKQIEEFDRLSREVEIKGTGKRGVPPRIPVENWDDAEELAVRYVKWLGFSDARRTKTGSDEGKDVESSKCVAQVKDMGTGATRPMLQQLYGVASAEKKKPLFFSRSYARTALEWGENHGIALFKFDLRGAVTPVSTAAKKLLGA